MHPTRRRFLTSLGGAAGALVVAGPFARALAAPRTTFIVTTSTVEVFGRTVERLDIVQPNGARGVETILGAAFAYSSSIVSISRR